MKKRLCYLLSAVMTVSLILSLVIIVTAAADGAAVSSTDTYTATKDVTVEPFTLAATIHVPSDTADNKRCGVVISNYSGAAGRSYSLEIHQNGNPRLFIQTTNSTAVNLIFKELDVRSDEPVRVSITMDKVNKKATCYLADLEGRLIGKQSLTSSVAYPSVFTADKKYMIGGDYRSGNSMAFCGTICYAAAYGDVRTEAECTGATVDGSDADMIFGYDMTAPFPLCLNDLSGNGNHLTNSLRKGMSFDSTVRQTKKPLSSIPKTIETWVYVPNLNRAGVMFGNYKNASCFNFEIGAGGNPKLYFKNASGTVENLIFKDSAGNNLVLKDEAWMHLAAVVEDTRVLLYKNGEIISEMPYTSGFSNDPLSIKFVLGGDQRANNVQYFKGQMMGLTAYTEARSADQIKADMLQTDLDADSLLLAYDLTNKTVADVEIDDLGTGGYDLTTPDANWLASNPSAPINYAYSFAVVGDTQCLTSYDSKNGTAITANIYDWIVANAKSKKMELVIGLGDITNDNTDAEWTIGKEQISKLDGVVPYVLNRGNPPHDNVAKFDEYMGVGAYPDMLNGTMSYGSYVNAYRKFTVGQTKYLIMMLDWGPSDDVLEWAGDVISANPDHRVIVTTHAYLYHDGTTLDGNDTAPAHKTGVSNGRNNGDEIWDELIKHHPNIVMVLSGHDPWDDIVSVQTVGVNGNTVTQMLIDPQGLDPAENYRTGMVAMLYFNEDGTEVSVEYISTVRANAGEPCYLKEDNQFDLTLLTASDYSHPDYSGTDVITRYGIIPASYADADKYPFAVFVPDTASATGYKFKTASASLLTDSTLGVSTTGCAMHFTREDGNGHNLDYNMVILMRRDFIFNAEGYYSNLCYGTGTVTVDLGGFSFYDNHSYNGGLFCWVPKRASLNKTLELVVRNGGIIVSGKPVVSYGDNLDTVNVNTFINRFENVRFSFASGATSDCIFAGQGFTSSDIHTVNTVVSYSTVDYTNSPVGADLLADGSRASNTFRCNGNTYINRKNVVPALSFTLSDGFILNAYVPVVTAESKDTVTAITLGGVEYLISNAEKVTVGGVEYFRASTRISPLLMGDYTTLTVDVSHVYTYYDGSTTTYPMSSSFSLDPIAYFTRLASDGNAVNATLGKDVLSYVRSVYAYAEADGKVIERIDGIIGADYDENAAPEQTEAKEITDGMSSAMLKLGGIPTFIFYPELDEEGEPLYPLELYAFSLNGKYRLNAVICTDENGKSYFTVSSYAYTLAGNIEYAVKGTDIHGCYNLKAYHGFAIESQDAALVRLVERLMKYAQSADAYRNDLLSKGV